MKELNDNVVVMKSMDFAVRCVRLAKYLRDTHHEYDLASQILRSGTSVGANVREALRGQSRADFRARMNISLREPTSLSTGWPCCLAWDLSPKGSIKVCLPIARNCANSSWLS